MKKYSSICLLGLLASFCFPGQSTNGFEWEGGMGFSPVIEDGGVDKCCRNRESLLNNPPYEDPPGSGEWKLNYDSVHDAAVKNNVASAELCAQTCLAASQYLEGLQGFTYYTISDKCACMYDNDESPAGTGTSCPNPNPAPFFDECLGTFGASGPIDWAAPNIYSNGARCYKYTAPDSHGDPHFRTWKNEHFEFHGQCDIVMASVKNFANRDIDLDIHLRTKMVRYWSYINAAAIRIGNDILEVSGLSDSTSDGYRSNYWINYEQKGELTDLSGFPVTLNSNRNMYTIDLGNAFVGLKIEIKIFKEFVGVKVVGGTEASFGKSVGIMGDFKNGNTYARDGSTIMDDFNMFGLEWQVLPSDGNLFHFKAHPQFPELCLLPEDPRGDRVRRLAESDVSEEAAEAACARLTDELDRKDCIYDILATQDLDMVGAY